MYEHAYHMDYGSAAPKYIDAFFQNINWQAADERLKKAKKVNWL
jgi:superoxide dismutase, Fe-Mn family